MRLICEIDAGDDFRRPHREGAEAAAGAPGGGAVAGDRRGGGGRERAGRGRAASLRGLQDRKRPGRAVLQVMRRKALDRLAARGGCCWRRRPPAAQPMMGGGRRRHAGPVADRRAAAARPRACRPARSACASRARCPPTRSRASRSAPSSRTRAAISRRAPLKTDDSGRVAVRGDGAGRRVPRRGHRRRRAAADRDVHDARRRAASARC